MTPEQRARSLYIEGETTRQTERGIAIIAQIIREAEDEAFERAARLVNGAFDLPNVADAIRQLKSGERT